MDALQISRPNLSRILRTAVCALILAGELATLHEQELSSRETEQRQTLRGELAENLNQAVRLLRQAENLQQISAVLAESSTAFSHLLAVFSVDGDSVRAERVRGLSAEAAGQFSGLELPIALAAAFTGAIETGDPVVATALLDRLLHHTTVLNINGDSYRMRAHRPAINALRPAITGGEKP